MSDIAETMYPGTNLETKLSLFVTF
jgi:hypothetical protein